MSNTNRPQSTEVTLQELINHNILLDGNTITDKINIYALLDAYYTNIPKETEVTLNQYISHNILLYGNTIKHQINIHALLDEYYTYCQ